MSINSKMTAIADAIRIKTDLNGTLTLEQMAEAIAGISISNGKNISTVDCVTMTTSGAFLGDVNNDGVVESTDLELVGKYVLDGAGDIDTEAADLDGDGMVSMGDMVTLNHMIEEIVDGQLIARITITYDDGSTEVFVTLVDAPIHKLSVTDDGEGNVELVLSRSMKVADDDNGNVTIM